MKVLLLDPQNVIMPRVEGLVSPIQEITLVSSSQVGNMPSDALRVDAILAGGDFLDYSNLLAPLLAWRTHPHTCLVPCWIASDHELFVEKCLWPHLAIDRFDEALDVATGCDWLTAVAEWQQNRMLLPENDSFRNRSVLELFTSLGLRKATGKLSLFDEEGGEGEVNLCEGCMTDASMGHLHDEEAFFNLFAWPSGSYLWEASPPRKAKKGARPLDKLLEETLKLIRDANILFHFLPDPHRLIERTASESALDDGAVPYFSGQKELYGLIEEGISVSQLLDASPLSRPRTMCCLSKWFSMGDIQVRCEEEERLSEAAVRAEPLPDEERPGSLSDDEAALSPQDSTEAGAQAEARFVETDSFPSAGGSPEAPEEPLEPATAANGPSPNPPPFDPVLAAPPAQPLESPAEEQTRDTQAPPAAEAEPPSRIHRVLIVDDSHLMCRALKGIFSKDPRFEVVGVAHDGFEALKLIEEQKPDVLTLDMQMPRMDGLTALKHIMIRFPRPVVVLSAFTKETSQLTYESFKYGAVDVLSKPSQGRGLEREKEAGQLCDRIAQASSVHIEAAQVIRRGRNASRAPGLPSFPPSDGSEKGGAARGIVLIGCGSGGFPSLLKLLFAVSRTQHLPTVLVCMAMPQRVVEALVPNLQKDCSMRIEELPRGAALEPGTCYLYSYDHCFHLSNGAHDIKLETNAACPEHHHSCDHLMFSIAETFGSRTAAFWISGTGDDGLEGVRYVQEKGGRTFVLSPAACLSPDLPLRILEKGYAREIKSIVTLAGLLEDHRKLLFEESAAPD